jgi:hypothetical protein
MNRPVELIPLRCVRCETPVSAQPDEVAWVCAQCGQGLLLDEERGLAPLEVHFATGGITEGQGNPFWVTEGQVLLQRETHTTFGSKEGDARQFWRRPHRFLVPAYTCPLDMLISLGTGLLRRPPELRPGEPLPFAPVTLLPQDVAALVDFIVVAIEAERADKVKSVRFSTQLSEPSLWILPV